MLECRFGSRLRCAFCVGHTWVLCCLLCRMCLLWTGWGVICMWHCMTDDWRQSVHKKQQRRPETKRTQQRDQGWSEPGLLLEFVCCSIWHFLKLMVGGFLWAIRFPLRLHWLMVLAKEIELKVNGISGLSDLLAVLSICTMWFTACCA